MGKKLLVALAMGVLVAAPSFAEPILRLTSGATAVTIHDNGAGDGSPSNGAIIYSGTVGDNFMLDVTTGITKPLLGTSNTPYLDLNDISVTSSAGGSLTMAFTETGFMSTSDVESFLNSIGGVVAFNPGSSLSYNVYIDTNNTAFGTGTLLSSSNFGPGAFSLQSSALASLLPSSPYSITLVADLIHTGAGSSSFNLVTTVPEPATIALFGVGLLGMVVRRRRRLTNFTVAHAVFAA